MSLLYRRCAGLDVHRDTVAVCARIRVEGRHEEQRDTFGTFTAELERLEHWLRDRRIRHVAMESTGVYLDAGMECAGAKPGALSFHAGQSGSGPCAGGPQDRSHRLRTDRRISAGWPSGR